MTFINIEEATELIWEFMIHAYGEMCLDEDWGRRALALMEEQRITPTHYLAHNYVDPMFTFQEEVELNYNRDVERAIVDFFIKEIQIGQAKWMEAWIYKKRPDLDTRADGILYWDMWQTFDNLIEEIIDDRSLEMVKERFGLNICLK